MEGRHDVPERSAVGARDGLADDLMLRRGQEALGLSHGSGAATAGVGSPLSSSGVGTGPPAHVASMIWTLVRTDIKTRYHGTVGGFAWALLKPVSLFVVLLGVFSLVFAPADPDYKLKLVLGLFLWEFFAEGTKAGLFSLFAKSYLVTKTRLPRWIVVAASISNAVVTLAAFAVALLLYLAWAGRFPGAGGLLLFALYVVQMWLIVLGFSLATSVLYLRYRDLNHLWDAICQAGFFVAPIIFPLEMLPEAVRPYLYLWPPTPVIVMARDVMIERTSPSLESHLFLLVVTLSILAAGVIVFRRHAARAAEYL